MNDEKVEVLKALKKVTKKYNIGENLEALKKLDEWMVKYGVKAIESEIDSFDKKPFIRIKFNDSYLEFGPSIHKDSLDKKIIERYNLYKECGLIKES